VNTLVGQERVIVSPIAGTTRDSVEVVLDRMSRRIILVDTAGLRKKGKLDSAPEFFSHARTRQALRNADAVIFMLDVTEKLGEVDKKIGESIEVSKRPVVLALNKWDRVPKQRSPDEFLKYVELAFPLLRYAPVCILSAKTGLNAGEVLDVAIDVHTQAGVRIPTKDLNAALKHLIEHRTVPVRGTRTPHILYGVQTRAYPPTLRLYVNHASWFTAEYLRYLENRFREMLPVAEVPFVLELKDRRGKN
jgi:GTP-binding protein